MTPPKVLNWCVGKFIFQRGARDPLHFTPMQDFLIEEAVDNYYFLLLRTLRRRGHSVELPHTEDPEWIRRTGVKLLSKLVNQVMSRDSIEDHPFKIAEFNPGVGLVYEALKLMSAANSAHKRHTDIQYTGVGAASFANKFRVFHAEGRAPDYVCDDSASPNSMMRQIVESNDVLIYNHNQAVRQRASYRIKFEDFLTGLSLADPNKQIVIAVRALLGCRAEVRTGVNGNRHRLLPLTDILSMLGNLGNTWRYQVIDEFDDKFFLPGSHKSGLLLAYAGRNLVTFEDFSEI